jgi:hypothetical protein
MARIKRVHLYFDDSGVRRPDHNPQEHQRDQMDHFALGGILIHEEEIGALIATHRAFTANWKITDPLHSLPPSTGHRDANCSRAVYALPSIARRWGEGPIPVMICPRSLAQNSGFHRQTRSHHAVTGRASRSWFALRTDAPSEICKLMLSLWQEAEI